MKEQHTYTGLWITEDGFIRHELLPNGRYDEARGTKPHAYQGDYDIRENRIYYQDDTGFTADGTLLIMTNFTTQEWCFSAANK